MTKTGDIERGTNDAVLYPDMAESPMLRWGFIRKVYSIVALQLILTAGVASTFIFVRPIKQFLFSGTPAALGVLIVIIILPFVAMIPMIFLKNKHPWNMFFLGLFTICFSLSIGLACSTKSGKVVFEAAVLTGVVVVGLTLYTFWAAKRGHDFSFLGPFLFAGFLVLMVYALIQIFFPLGAVGQTIYGCLAALVFAGYIIYDTDNLIKRFSYDEYVSAAICLYLDIINLFMAILTIFSATDD